MPEGDVIHRAAEQIRAATAGRVPDELLTPQARHSEDDWPARLAGRAVRSVDAHGKHLFIRFDGELVIHSHLRMTGAWSVQPTGRPWRRAARRAWLVLRAAGHDVVQFDGPVLELLTQSRTRFDRQLAALGPDVLAERLDEREVLRRIRDDDPTRPLGEALLDQRLIAGLGTIWRSEACFGAGVDPWRSLKDVDDGELVAVMRSAREQMQRSVEHGIGRRDVYRRAGRPCGRCGTLVRHAIQGDEGRLLYWCPGCQR